MIVANMFAETVEILCEQTIDLASLSESVESCSTKFSPSIRSGSHTDVGCRKSNQDEHICIDDVSNTLGGSLYQWPLPTSFYAVFDGHGGSEASSYMKENAMKLFFLDSHLPQQTSDIDDLFLQQLEDSYCKAFLLADKALADECSISDYCGTTALTALILGKHLIIANAGDCRAVLCRNGIAVQMSQDHTPVYLEEKIRVESLGGYIKYGYLNGELAVTRALGDWYMQSSSPLIATPDVIQKVLTEDDEFLIIACDGIWDVMSNQEAVGFVRQELRLYDDPNRCARQLVNKAFLRYSTDNLTAIVVCFSRRRPRPTFRCSLLTEDARDILRNLLEGN
ncbi:LOW QUALITY PROTEIN: probable protein phosphatase 2C 43 [Rutidosis leptorrhynchoides]|uniref:LOW QUALITY PROTEIN: probable protein phosphatase 2C 43 n=1 Tax=Rutidosis leptorrhynchoides TaxID=125765 RepID=UPI003A99CBC4